MVDCKVVGSYTSTTTFHLGVGSTGPSNATVTSPPRGAAMSSSTLTPVFASNFDSSWGKFESSLLPIIWNISSTMLRGFLMTTAFTMLASGETNSNDSHGRWCGQPGSHATPLRSERQSTHDFPSSLRPRGVPSSGIGRPPFPGVAGCLCHHVRVARQFVPYPRRRASPHPAGRNEPLAGRASVSAEMTGTGLLDPRRRALQLRDIRTGNEHIVIHINQERTARQG